MRELRIAIPDHDRALQALRDTDALTRRPAGHGALPVRTTASVGPSATA
jgi:hypothetical protein